MITIVVTEREYYKAEKVFSRSVTFHCVPAPSEEKELARAIRSVGAKHAIVGVDKYEGPLYDALPPGGVLARFGVGHDGIDKTKACSRGLLCVNTPLTLDDSVAEHTVALILAAARKIIHLANSTKQGGWMTDTGNELSGKTLAIVGCGGIGRRVSRIAASGFGMKVIGCDVLNLDMVELRAQAGFSRLVKDYADAAQHADYVSLHIPSNPMTRHFMNKDRLSLMPAHAWLVNTARGALVDERALYDALTTGVIRGAALDVFESEPYRPVEPTKDLRNLENVIMTPHLASSTQEACQRMAEQALHNIALAKEGKFGQMNLLNPQVLEKRRWHEKQTSSGLT